MYIYIYIYRYMSVKEKESRFFFRKLVEVVFESNGGRETHILTGSTREKRSVSSDRYTRETPRELWD